jgi:hypothetical protein
MKQVRQLLRGGSTRLAMIALPMVVAGALIAPTAVSAAPAASAQSTTVTAADTSQAAATSAASFSDCPLQFLCFWVDAGPSGAMGKFKGDNDNWGNFSQQTCQTHNWNDCASALYNHGEFDAVSVFQDINGSGGSACLLIGTKWSNLTVHNFQNGANMNDQISSNKWHTSNSC